MEKGSYSFLMNQLMNTELILSLLPVAHLIHLKYLVVLIPEPLEDYVV